MHGIRELTAKTCIRPRPLAGRYRGAARHGEASLSGVLASHCMTCAGMGPHALGRPEVVSGQSGGGAAAIAPAPTSRGKLQMPTPFAARLDQSLSCKSLRILRGRKVDRDRPVVSATVSVWQYEYPRFGRLHTSRQMVLPDPGLRFVLLRRNRE